MLDSTRLQCVLRVLGLTFVLAVLAVPAMAQDGGNTVCPYDPNLEWGDFQGTPPDDPGDAAAETFSDPSVPQYTPKVKKNADGTYTVTSDDIHAVSGFDKSQSWVLPDAKTPELLQHEQYHLDLSEIWARKLDAEVKALEGNGATPQAAANDLQAKVQAAFDKNKKDCDAEQKKYDDETDHGRKEAEQAAWCEKIRKALGVETPNEDKAESNSIFDFDGFSGQGFIPPTFVDGFYCQGLGVHDPYLLGAFLELPPLFFEGYHMEETSPLFAPYSDDAAVRLHGPDGIALSGNLRVLMIEGNTMSGWLENLVIETQALESSIFLQLLDESLDGDSVVTVSFTSEVPFEDATGGFSDSAQLPVTIEFGSWAETPLGEPVVVPAEPIAPFGINLD